MKSGPKPIPLAVRLWRRVLKTQSCWLWTGGPFAKRHYGRLYVGDGKSISAHHAAYILSGHTIPEGKILLHTCDNRRCVNPAHLFPGTKKQNTQDMLAKHREAWGERHWNHKLNADQVAAIRQSSRAGRTGRRIARAFGVSPGTVSRIIHKTLWKHL